MAIKTDDFAAKIRELYALTADLERIAAEKGYPDRHFTPDGHMVGSIGEVIAAEEYGLKLFTASAAVYDAESTDKTKVQIKATQRNRISIDVKGGTPNHLIVLKLNEDGSFEEVYNGPGEPAMKHAGKPQKTGQQSIALSKLREEMSKMDGSQRIPGKSDALRNNVLA